MPRGKRRSKEEIQGIVKQLEASGQSVREFAKTNGLAVSTLDLWRRKERASTKTARPQLRRVSVVGSGGVAEPFQIEMPGGAILRVPTSAPVGSTEVLVSLFLSACSR